MRQDPGNNFSSVQLSPECHVDEDLEQNKKADAKNNNSYTIMNTLQLSIYTSMKSSLFKPWALAL
jgi:hypothetical protein